MEAAFFESLVIEAKTKIVLIIMDGLGGLAREPGGPTELETARTPHLDELAARSALGFTLPAGPGITVGSGPGHLGIFGYDPIEYQVGRGVLEALGAGFQLGPNDIAARGNFCTIDAQGLLTDRRAGRIATEPAARLVEMLRSIRVDGVEIELREVKEHRFAFVMRGEGLGDGLAETDPLKLGLAPLPVRARRPDSERAAALINAFLDQARRLLAGQSPANMILLRGFDSCPRIPSFWERYKLRAAAIPLNGMYKGVGRLVGMDVLDVPADTLDGQFDVLEQNWAKYDFFYLHMKKVDQAGEDGDFERKAREIEAVDARIPRLMALRPDVVIVGGDHSSPAVMKAHSWHPVPVLLYGRWVRADDVAEFGERACLRGSLGVQPAKNIMRLALANAGRVAKYGA